MRDQTSRTSLQILLRTAFIATLLAGCRAQDAEPSLPYWDGHEPVKNYALGHNLKWNQTVNLSNGAQIEFMLIPAGIFKMGTPNPDPPDDLPLSAKIRIAALTAILLPVCLLGYVIWKLKKRKRLQFSLKELAISSVVLSGALLSVVNWNRASTQLLLIHKEYESEKWHWAHSESNEMPVHRVEITKAFYLSKFPITQEQYLNVMGVNPSSFRGRTNPVENVSWSEANEFCNRLSAQLGTTIRLPTEAEWEYACRSGTDSMFYSGDKESDLDRAAWYESNSIDSTHSVGLKAPNNFGLYDMLGNVWEWCSDNWDADYYSTSPSKDPKGPPGTGEKVLRGGSWNDHEFVCRCAKRERFTPETHSQEFGFRVVMAR